MSIMTPQQKKDDGVSLHGGADEHSLMLYLQPNLVSRGYKTAKSITGSNYDESFAVSKGADWAGYIGAPKHGSVALGRHIWTSFSGAALKTTLEILDGKDPTTYPRYLSFLVKNPLYQDWIKTSNDRDSTLAQQQADWRRRRAPASP